MWLWPNLRYDAGICLEGLRKAMKNFTQYSQSLSWQLNPEPPNTVLSSHDRLHGAGITIQMSKTYHFYEDQKFTTWSQKPTIVHYPPCFSVLYSVLLLYLCPPLFLLSLVYPSLMWFLHLLLGLLVIIYPTSSLLKLWKEAYSCSQLYP
jgi:hypothetical protein